MKTLMTIGYTKFLLPSNANVNAVLAVLTKAIRVREEYKTGRGSRYYPEIKEDHSDISIKLIDDDSFIDTRKLKRLPEHASPDADNTF